MNDEQPKMSDDEITEMYAQRLNQLSQPVEQRGPITWVVGTRRAWMWYCKINDVPKNIEEQRKVARYAHKMSDLDDMLEGDKLVTLHGWEKTELAALVTEAKRQGASTGPSA
jgi:hypothetical protein